MYLSIINDYKINQMNILRKHWFDIGGMLSIIVIAFVFINHANLTNYQLLMCLSLVSLFFHQLEEYRVVGTFPGMVNKVMYNSNMPDRYPLNTNTALYVNVFVGWSIYLLAALLAEKAIWLGMATILVSLGNTMAHTIVFNKKGKTLYNAGMATSWLLFVPITICFFRVIHAENLVGIYDYIAGIPLGIAINVIGIIKMIDWMKDRNTSYIFPARCVR